ncbi:ROK family protein [Phytoactinopolyspora mesophila]|uniref:ROK family protein n=1 Tax=Phytoactinopolyspora mesophila TaxID=2650750 RepID=UPI0013917253
MADAVGVSRTAAQQIVDELVGLRWVSEDGSAGNTPPRIGPAPRYYRFRAEAGYVAGVDIGRHRVSTKLADLSGAVVAAASRPVAIDAPVAARFDAVRDLVESCLTRARVRSSQLWTLAVGSRGVVHDGRVIYVGEFPGWSGINLVDTVSEMFDRPVVADNDCNLAAMAEHWAGAAKDVDDVVCIEVGRAIGAGVMIGGRVLHGFGGYAGELHHLPFNGWLHAAEHLDADPRHASDIKAVFDAAREGDAVAASAVDKYSRVLAEGIATICAVVDPQLVVLGGAVSESGDTLLEPVRRHLEQFTARMPRIQLSTLGADAVALGAVRAALDHVDTLVTAATDRRGDLPPPQRRVIQPRAQQRRGA